MADSTGSEKNIQGWWTWVVPLFVFQGATQLSLLSMVSTGTSVFYMPVPFGLCLIYWWGPRILPAFYLNATLSAGLWGLSDYYNWPLYGLPETFFVGFSWWLFVKKRNGKIWLPDNQAALNLLLFGILIPLLSYKLIQQTLFVLKHVISPDFFILNYIKTFLGDFISIFAFTVPLLYFLTPLLSRKNMLISNLEITSRPLSSVMEKRQLPEFLVIFVLQLALSLFLPFSEFWFVYGMFSMYVAIRMRFSFVIIANLYILLLTYLMPVLIYGKEYLSQLQDIHLINVYLGSSLLYVFSFLTGRIMSDFKKSQAMLRKKNEELEHTNKELDRFVYSASHDLSAPLKSILGLVNITKLEPRESDQQFHLNLIETSVKKLDLFINEILDYSRNKRLEVHAEAVHLKELCDEILSNLSYIDGFQNMRFDLAELNGVKIIVDKLRLKIILNNILSNGIKFQKPQWDEKPFLRIISQKEKSNLKIIIEDNGEGIKAEMREKIFDMFFRGSTSSRGSGLGLYIAREAAEKIGGKIKVDSEYGKGSTFVIEIPQLV